MYEVKANRKIFLFKSLLNYIYSKSTKRWTTFGKQRYAFPRF